MYGSDRQYSAYIDSGDWKCSQSSTGAHHWVGNNIEMECKYCHKKQKVEYGNAWNTWQMTGNKQRNTTTNKNRKLQHNI